MTAAEDAPLLVAKNARIALDGVVALDDVTLTTRGKRLVVVGNAGPLMAALTGIPMGVTRAASHAAAFEELIPVGGASRAVSGELRLAGMNVVAGEHLARVGAAPHDPPFPPGWSVEHYLVQMLRVTLASQPERVSLGEIKHRVRGALEYVGLGGARGKGLTSLHIPERRVMMLAMALACDPPAVVADRPLADIEPAAAPFVLGALQAVAGKKPIVVSLSRLAPGTVEGTFARGASDLAAFTGSELSMFGAPAEVLDQPRTFRVTVRSNADALKAALTERGASMEGGPTRFSVKLAEDQDPSFVLALASELRSAVVEIVPLV